MDSNTGWIKLYRDLLNKPIWLNSTPQQKTILITLLLMANHEEAEWEWKCKKFKVRPGQFVTSLKSIVKNCGDGVTMQNVRTALVRFEKLEFLTNQSTKSGRLITIVNWGAYQDKKETSNNDTHKDLTKTSQRPNKDLTPNKNDNNNKNDKKIYSDFEIDPEFIGEVIKLYPGKKTKAVRDSKLPKLVKEFGKEQIIRCIKRYSLEVQGKDRQYILNEKTFWNSRYEDYLDENYQEEPDQTEKHIRTPREIVAEMLGANFIN